ncbi:MAG: Na-translocating system protein MpsC family protein [Clostridia bacterium]|nr:Na-translocating system protein MpsC family protein [Clostridia bacterium]
MEQRIEQLEKDIGLIISKVIKQFAGKGPRKVSTYVKKDIITVRINDFLTDMELTMNDSPNGKELVKGFRHSIQEKLTIPMCIEKIQEITASTIDHCYSDLCPHRNEAILVFILIKDIN